MNSGTFIFWYMYVISFFFRCLYIYMCLYFGYCKHLWCVNKIVSGWRRQCWWHEAALTTYHFYDFNPGGVLERKRPEAVASASRHATKTNSWTKQHHDHLSPGPPALLDHHFSLSHMNTPEITAHKRKGRMSSRNIIKFPFSIQIVQLIFVFFCLFYQSIVAILQISLLIDI